MWKFNIKCLFTDVSGVSPNNIYMLYILYTIYVTYIMHNDQINLSLKCKKAQYQI